MSIASDPSDSHTENRQYPYLTDTDIALFPDEISIRYLYAILCTMFHRFGLYRVQFPFKLACQIKVHDNSPLLKRSYYITMDWGCQFSVKKERQLRYTVRIRHSFSESDFFSKSAFYQLHQHIDRRLLVFSLG